MPRFQVIPFEEVHLAVLPQGREGGGLEVFREVLEGPYRESVLEYSQTLLLDGLPVAAWGVLPLWAGVGVAWALVGAPCARHPVPLVRQARKSLALAHQSLSLRRIHAEVSASLPAGVRFAQLVGFEPEGLLRGYGAQGGDFWMVASVPRGTFSGTEIA